MPAQFHLSLGVKDLQKSVNFFETILGASVSHRDPSGYVNVLVYDHQITLRSHHGINPDLPHFHFGFNMTREQFDSTAERILQIGREYVAAEPMIVDGGTPLERKKMFLTSPSGYSIELKGLNTV